jgi:hypothetical protein
MYALLLDDYDDDIFLGIYDSIRNMDFNDILYRIWNYDTDLFRDFKDEDYIYERIYDKVVEICEGINEGFIDYSTLPGIFTEDFKLYKGELNKINLREDSETLQLAELYKLIKESNTMYKSAKFLAYGKKRSTNKQKL